MKVIKFAQKEFVSVDSWVPEPEDRIFKHTKDFIIIPISEKYNIENPSIDYFNISKKRSYNKMRGHITQYINYFLKFYDTEHELFHLYANFKLLMSLDEYNKKAFFYDIDRYILSIGMRIKINSMNSDNYSLSLRKQNTKDPSLQYTNKHGYIMMQISLIMNLIIPLLTHFIYTKKVNDTNSFLLEAYDIIISKFESINLYNKLYETTVTNINKNKNSNPIWSKQDIRGINPTTHTKDSIENIILHVMPNYEYCQNIIVFNYRAIINNIGYRVTNNGYEFQFIPLSSSERDAEDQSEFDRFENFLTKSDESLYLQNKVNCQETMDMIEQNFGPYDQNEIDFYVKELTSDGKGVINSFQKNLIFNLFYKYFGDPVSIKAINREDYIKLMITAKRILRSNNMIILPYILSGKVIRLPQRNNINKKELNKIQASTYYPYIVSKYNNPKIEKYIFTLIARILVSDFDIIDYHDKELNGVRIDMISDIVCDEMLVYLLLI